MKKALIGTSALIAVGLLTAQGALAADRISLGISGNYRVMGGIVNQDDGATESVANARDHGIGADGKINFRGSTTLDNGIEVGVQIELEAQNTAERIDEQYMWIENTDVWGRVEMGDRDGAGNKMNVLAPTVHFAAIVGLQVMQLASAPGAGGVSAFGGTGTNSAAVPVAVPGLSGDSTKITYYSPDLAGAQLGISYSPDASEDNGSGFSTPIGATAISPGAGPPLGEIIEIGLKWGGDIGDAAVRVSAAMANGSSENAAGVNVNDQDMWSAAFSVSMNNFAFGAQYHKRDTGQGTAATTIQRDDITMRTGLTYSMGLWNLGVEYASHVVEVSATGEDQVTVWGVGANRSLGAGISAGVGIHLWDWSDDLSVAANENDATEFFFITSVSF